MKPLNLLQNMSAEAKVLAMALPMLLLGALSAMAKQDEGYIPPEKMDLPHIVNHPGDTARVQPVDKTKKEEKLPGKKKPKSPGLDSYTWGGKPMPASPDSASVEPAQQPQVDGIPPMPRINRGEPEQDGKYVPRIPGDEDVYESPYIKDYTTQSGIAEVAVDNQPSQAAQGVFTLSGLRVSESADLSGLAPGLYIVNGKKMLVR